jgi:hypothetical protein
MDAVSAGPIVPKDSPYTPQKGITLKLWGFFTHIDNYKKLCFKYIADLNDQGDPILTDISRPEEPPLLIPVGEYVCWDKLVRACDANDHYVHNDHNRKLVQTDVEAQPPLFVLPYDTRGFTVVFESGASRAYKNKPVPDDIQRKVATECTIFVKVARYCFDSKLPENKGQKISGVKLILSDIKSGLK